MKDNPNNNVEKKNLMENFILLLKNIKGTILSCLETKDVFENNNSNNSKVHNEIINLLKNQERFSFSDEKNVDKISKILDLIRILYIKYFDYLLKWEFHFNNIDEIILELEKSREDFNNLNVDTNNNKFFQEFLNDIQSLIHDIKKIKDLKSYIELKRKNIFIPYWITEKDWNNASTERKLFIYLFKVSAFQYSIDDNFDYENEIITDLISIYQEVINLSDEEYTSNIKIIKDFLILNLFKLSLIYKINRFNYYEDWKIKYLDIEKEFRESSFSKFWNILTFIFWNKVNKHKFIEEFKFNVFEKKNISSLGIFVLLKNYKDYDKSKIKLKEVYDTYRKYISIDLNVETLLDDKYKYYLNCLYAWNNYLSFLIEEYKSTWKAEIVSEIDNFYLELINLSKKISNTNFKNYFTYYKYSIFKCIEYAKLKDDENIPYKYINWILDTSLSSINKSLKIFNNINYHNYFEFDIEDFFVNLNWYEDKIYCHNLYVFPFRKDIEKKKIENAYDLAKDNIIDIKYKQKFWDIKEKIEWNKLEAMTIIWIFTWIVVYSIWTIQIFSIIEDLWSAVLFAWIFLSWMLFLLWWIFFKSHLTIKNDLKYNKWLQLFLIGLIILTLSIFWKFYFSSDKWVLNWNRWEQIYNKLDLKVKEANEIKEYMDQKIKKYEELNNSLNDKLKELDK